MYQCQSCKKVWNSLFGGGTQNTGEIYKHALVGDKLYRQSELFKMYFCKMLSLLYMIFKLLKEK